MEGALIGAAAVESGGDLDPQPAGRQLSLAPGRD
jgi:hypothetical protein